MKYALILGAAAMAAPLAATQASAQAYTYDGRTYFNSYQQCEDSRRGGRIGGAIIGGVAGAVLGDNLSGSEDEGAAIGGALGALIGSEIGDQVQKRRCIEARGYDVGYGSGQYQTYQPYQQQSGHYGYRTVGQPYGGAYDPYRRSGSYQPVYNQPREVCGYGQQQIVSPNGYVLEERDVYMCKDYNGRWEIRDRRY